MEQIDLRLQTDAANISNVSDYANDHVQATADAHAATAISVTESGIIIPGAMSVQQAMRAIEFQAEQLRQQLGSHHHDERYLHPVCRIIKSGTQVINNTTGGSGHRVHD
jgi:NAD/NADP transhydrogenase beta subunit